MKYLLVLFFSAAVTSCAQVDNNSFDQDINAAFIKYKTVQSVITDADFSALSEKIIQNRPWGDQGRMDAYSLTGYINTTHPAMDEVLNRYAQLENTSKFIFLEALLGSNRPFFQDKKKVFHKLISEAVADKDHRTVKQLLLFYTQDKMAGINEYKNLLDGKKMTTDDLLLLSKLVIAEKENDLGLALLTYIDKNPQTREALNYISYWDLYSTQNKTLNSQYKAFLRSKLETETLDGRAWGGYAAFLTNWFNRDEIMALCRLKKKTKPFNVNDYISRAGYYQAAYFPIDNSLQLIETAPTLSNKLSLAFMLANVSTGLSVEQKEWLSNYFGRLADKITGSTESELIVLLERSLHADITHEAIKKKYPRLFDKWSTPAFLENTFNAAKYNWRDAIRVCNDLKTFNREMEEPDEYSKAEYMAGNGAFRLNARPVLDMIFEKNKVRVELPFESGEFPIDYGYIVNNSIKDVFINHNINYSILCNQKYLNGDEMEYTIYIKTGNRLLSVQFNGADQYTDNEAIYLLLNKALMTAGIPQRLIKYNTDNGTYNMVFAEPAKFTELRNKIMPAPVQ